MKFSASRSSIIRVTFLIVIFLICQTGVTQPVLKKSHKDDRVVLDNGDVLTGEIKKVEFGILYFKSDRAIGTLELDWIRVHSIRSTARFEFETSDGRTCIGTPDSINQTNQVRLLIVRLDNGEFQQFTLMEIVGIHEMQQSFWGRIDLTLDAGITYTQGNNQTQVTMSSSLKYVKPRYSLRLAGDSIFSGQDDGTNTSRNQFSFAARRDLSLKWDYLGLITLLHDNQQDLDQRTVVAGGFDRRFIKTNRTLFTGVLGFAFTRENYIPENDSDRSSKEILLGISFSSYRFAGSEIFAHILVFPSVTDPGRVRVDTDVYWKWEIVNDLYWKLSAFDNYDSSPPSGSSGNSFGLTSSIGWSF